MIVKELFRAYDWPSVELALLSLYPDEAENTEEYEEIFADMKSIPVSRADLKLVIRRLVEEDDPEESYIEVFGVDYNEVRDDGTFQGYALEFMPWSDWMSMEIAEETLREFNELEIIVHCLYEMTYVSFDEEDIRGKWDDILEHADDGDHQQEDFQVETISLEQLVMDLDDFHIREAVEGEEEILTEISVASKNFWNYPEEYFQVWIPELTITTEYLKKNKVFVYEEDEEIVAFYSLVHLKEPLEYKGDRMDKGWWIDHMFIYPDSIGRGIGERLFRHMNDYLLSMEVKKVSILSDPNSKGFYEKMGCRFVKNFPSSIEGRETPMYVYQIRNFEYRIQNPE